MKRRMFFCGLAAVGLTGCTEPVTHATASGKPEVVVRGRNSEWVKGKLVNSMLNRGYSISNDTGYTIAFDRPVQNAFAAALLGSSYDSSPNTRVTFSTAEVSGGTRVVADLAVITNPGSAFERRTAFNGHEDSLQIQQMLNDLAKS